MEPHTVPAPALEQHDDGASDVLDAQAIADKFKAWRGQGRLNYLQQLESRAPLSKLAHAGAQLPPNVQPSLLQLKLCSGSNRLSHSLLLTCSPDGLTFLNMPINSSSTSTSTRPNNNSWQFGLHLLNATHVGPTGFGSAVQPVRHVARCCIFDRQNNRFLGNVHTVPASQTTSHKGIGSVGYRWMWDSAGPQACAQASTDGELTDIHHQQLPRLDPISPGQLVGCSSSSIGGTARAVAAAGEVLAAAVGNCVADDSTGGLGGANACIVRCSELSQDPVSGVRKLDGERLSLYIELNVALRLVAEDGEAVPQDEAKGAGMVDELTTCWAMISLKRCAELVREMAISVPLYTGSIYEPVLLSALWTEQRKHHPVRSLFSTQPNPQLTFRAGPLPTLPSPLLPYRLMPQTLIARRDVAYLLAAARLALEQHLRVGSLATGACSINSPAEKHDPPERREQDDQTPASTIHATTMDDASCSLPLAAACVGFGDAALAALPKLLDDPVLLRELLAKWDARVQGLQQAAEAAAKAAQGADCLLSAGCSSAVGCTSIMPGSCHPSQQQLQAALRMSLLELSPLLHCDSLPPSHISVFLEHQAHRAAVAGRFCRAGLNLGDSELDMDGCSAAAVKLRGVSLGRPPVDVLSRAAGEFVHRPFDVAETRMCLADWLGAAKWNRC